jgi:hypothetical protein
MLGQGSYMICRYNPHWEIMWEGSMRRSIKGMDGKELVVVVRLYPLVPHHDKGMDLFHPAFGGWLWSSFGK